MFVLYTVCCFWMVFRFTVNKSYFNHTRSDFSFLSTETLNWSSLLLLKTSIRYPLQAVCNSKSCMKKIMPNAGIKRGLDIHLLKLKTHVNRCPNGSLVNLGKVQDALTDLVECV